jgi:chemotaxis protein histidine kinase CheA
MEVVMDQELVEAMCQETLSLCQQLEDILEDYDEDEPFSLSLEKFGQTIDRIMGAAKSLGLERIGLFSELGKIISYKASQTNSKELTNIVVGTMADCVDIIRALSHSLNAGKGEIVQDIDLEAFSKRLEWLSSKFKHIDRSSVAIEGAENLDQLVKKI